MTAKKPVPEGLADPWVGIPALARSLDISVDLAKDLVEAGSFGKPIDVAPRGSRNSYLRVRQSAVLRWIEGRQVKG